jgi:hypothetical protein
MRQLSFSHAPIPAPLTLAARPRPTRRTSPKRCAQASAATAPAGAPAAGGPPRRPAIDGSQVQALRAMLTRIKGEAEAGGGAPRAAAGSGAPAPEAPRAAAARLASERDAALELAEMALRGQEALLADRCRLAGECAALRRERDDLAERVAFLLHAGVGECGYDEPPITPDSAAMRALRAGEAGAGREGLDAVAARLDLGA